MCLIIDRKSLIYRYNMYSINETNQRSQYKYLHKK